MTLQAKLIAIAFLVGLLLGAVVCSVIHRAGMAAALKEQIAKDQHVIDQRAADEQKAADHVSQQLVEAQTATHALNVQLNELRSANATLTDQISHAQFHPAPVPAPSRPGIVCPGHPVASAEFLRLYNAASAAASPYAQAGSTR